MSLPIAIWLILVFIMGCCVGSFINVCVYRLPLEKSVFWPGSHCGKCFSSIRWLDNIPLLSYWILGGKCRSCQASFSLRYFLVELFVGIVFTCLFYVDLLGNHFGLAFLSNKSWHISNGLIPWEGWAFFLSHALLASFLITASLTDIDCMEIPLGITVWGTVLGLIYSSLFPWPFPEENFQLVIKEGVENKWPFAPVLPFGGFPWPFWAPLATDGFREGAFFYGFLQGLAGALAGTFLLRIVRFCYGVGRGIEVMGLGDADLMMMVGAFLGWQIVVVAFFLSVLPAFFMGMAQLLFRGSQAFPFGPSLAISSVGTLYAWPWIAPKVQPFFFDAEILTLMGLMVLVGLGTLGIAFRFLLGKGSAEAPPGQGNS
ncbi:MAG: prepilin peptidase [Gemmataceae bacterium]|nr:prepilin peptidase [Gemmataceae bacterium]